MDDREDQGFNLKPRDFCAYNHGNIYDSQWELRKWLQMKATLLPAVEIHHARMLENRHHIWLAGIRFSAVSCEFQNCSNREAVAGCSSCRGKVNKAILAPNLVGAVMFIPHSQTDSYHIGTNLSQVANLSLTMELSPAKLAESLKEYYSIVFPAQQIVSWLNYKDGDPDVFRNREFSMTLPGDIYIRYLTFEDYLDLRIELVRKIPIKIDVGAVYNANPRAHKSTPFYDFRPVQHELVFDIDISDYNDVRTCCKDSAICQKCWPFMAIGAKILNTILTKEFGFKHLLFVFSGRRGFHCWVCDHEARFLTNEARRAIADYFAIVKGGENLVRRVELDTRLGLHPMITKSLDVIDEHFEDLMVERQDFLGNEHLIQNVIDLLPPLAKTEEKNVDQNFQNSLFMLKMRKTSSAEAWESIKRLSVQFNRRNKTRYFLEEVKLHHCFPRLDTNVTRGMNHLLKLPFCIHPKTGNVCVPLDIDRIEKFQLDKVPNIKNIEEVVAFAKSLEPYLNIMKKFCGNLGHSVRRKDSLEF